MSKRVGRRSPSPIHDPRGSYRSPHPHPSAPYPYPTRNRSAEIITISLLVAAFMLLGLGGMLWVVQARLPFGPTPTPTPTATAPLTATPDFRATRVAEDFLTQQAYQMALLGTLTPTPLDMETPSPPRPDSTPDATDTPVIVRLPGVNAPFTPSPSAEELAEWATAEAAATALAEGEILPPEAPTTNVVNLPIVGDNSPLSTPTPDQVAEQPEDIPTPEPTPTETPTETATIIPTDTPTVPVATPTPTETIAPPSPTPTSPGQIFVSQPLRGYMHDEFTALRLGPSNIYTATSEQLGPNTQVTILGRNPSGEWLYVCCLSDQTPYWVRQAYVDLRDNPEQPGAPEDADPNDVRWLPIQPPASYLPALPTPASLGPDDYPLYRYDRHGQGRVDQLPAPGLAIDWFAEAGQALRSPVAVMDSSVLVASADNELYSFDRVNGSQRWRLHIGQVVSLAPAIYDGEIFIVDQNRTVSAIEDHGNTAVRVWSVTLSQPALTSLNVYSDTLFIATGENTNHTLVALHRDNGATLRTFSTTGPGLRYPVIGDQLVYAADQFITALDVFNGEQVWEQSSVQNIMAGPVYASPGPSSLAELYVVAGNNRLYALDANTGDELWNRDVNEAEQATSLALNESFIFVAGNGYVKSFARHDQGERWRVAVNGPVLGGPLVDSSRVLVVTQFGHIELLDAQSGATLAAQDIPSEVGGAAAVSGPRIFVPGVNGRLYSVLGN